jgi:hypothetical protein
MPCMGSPGRYNVTDQPLVFLWFVTEVTPADRVRFGTSGSLE